MYLSIIFAIIISIIFYYFLNKREFIIAMNSFNNFLKKNKNNTNETDKCLIKKKLIKL